MPCKSHLNRDNPVYWGVVDVYRYLDELAGKSPKDRPWDYWPANQSGLDMLTAVLYDKLRSVDVKMYSLELQMWWRDNLKADKVKEERRARENALTAQRNLALAKLTDEECRLLGVCR